MHFYDNNVILFAPIFYFAQLIFSFMESRGF